ncbi:MAG: aminotransferase class IV [Verrucomicrobiales bacterium]|jgi:branched-chain amino acid aminotransferase|nr:aminotransferase class IV [Verrucomicrobiales bacterium]
MLQQFHPANTDLLVNINGTLVHRDEAGVSPFDSSVQNGDAVWEGLRLYEGRIFKLEEHLERLRRSAELLEYQGYPEEEVIVEQLKRTLVANDMFDSVHVRLTISRGIKYTSGLDPRINTQGCSFFILAEHKAPVYDKAGLVLHTATVRRPFANVLDQHIHSCNQLTSILAKLEANAVGADDALLLDTEGNVAETNATHLFFVKDGVVITPTTRACPEGITRMTVLSLCEQHEIPSEVRDIPEAEIHESDEVFCTGTMGEIAAVTRIAETQIGNGKPGPVTQRLSQLYGQVTATVGTRVV